MTLWKHCEVTSRPHMHKENRDRYAYSSRQKWSPDSEAGLLGATVEHTAVELFDAANQDR